MNNFIHICISLFLMASCGQNSKLREISRFQESGEVQSIEPEKLIQVDSYKQLSEEKKKINLLFVIDNSGSMINDITSIAQNFKLFTNHLIGANGETPIDFQIKATTSDLTPDGSRHLRAVRGNNTYLTTKIHTPGKDMTENFPLNTETAVNSPDYFKELMERVFTMGTGLKSTSSLPGSIDIGSGSERMLGALKLFIDKHENYIREDRNLAIVLISDEYEHSTESASDVISLVRDLKKGHENKNILSFSFINPRESSPDYQSIVDLSDGGQKKTISDMASNLEGLGKYIQEKLLGEFSLSKKPKVSTLKVFISGRDVTSEKGLYEYLSKSNSVKFSENSLPKFEEEVRIEYEYENL